MYRSICLYKIYTHVYNPRPTYAHIHPNDPFSVNYVADVFSESVFLYYSLHYQCNYKIRLYKIRRRDF